MNKRICIIILLLTCRICYAQNLIPNGDFEQYLGCPTNIGQLDTALFWFNPCGGTPDYYNGCAQIGGGVNVPYAIFGYQLAHSGIAYAGLYMIAFGFPNYREYIEVPLISPLSANVCYYFEMFVNLSNMSVYASDTISAYFSDTIVAGLQSSTSLLFNSQIKNTTGFITDTLNWTKVSGTFTAVGGESYLIIGNQNDDLHTATLNFNSGSFISYVYIDDVSLYPCTGIEEQNTSINVKLFPNPFFNELNISIKENNLAEILLYDITSRKILQQKFTNSVTLNTEQLAKGLYLYEVRNKDGSCKKGKIVKD